MTSYILTIILFSGNTIKMEYPTASVCENALYDTMDKVLPKNVKFADCTAKKV